MKKAALLGMLAALALAAVPGVAAAQTQPVARLAYQCTYSGGTLTCVKHTAATAPTIAVSTLAQLLPGLSEDARARLDEIATIACGDQVLVGVPRAESAAELPNADDPASVKGGGPASALDACGGLDAGSFANAGQIAMVDPAADPKGPSADSIQCSGASTNPVAEGAGTTPTRERFKDWVFEVLEPITLNEFHRQNVTDQWTFWASPFLKMYDGYKKLYEELTAKPTEAQRPGPDVDTSCEDLRRFFWECEQSGWQTGTCQDFLHRMNQLLHDCADNTIARYGPDSDMSCSKPEIDAETAERLTVDLCGSRVAQPVPDGEPCLETSAGGDADRPVMTCDSTIANGDGTLGCQPVEDPKPPTRGNDCPPPPPGVPPFSCPDTNPAPSPILAAEPAAGPVRAPTGARWR